MNIGKKTTCGHCGADFSFMLDKHDVEDCFDNLRGTNERLHEFAKNLLKVHEWRDDATADAILDALRGGGEHSKHPTGDYCVYCLSQWPCVEAGEQ